MTDNPILTWLLGLVLGTVVGQFTLRITIPRMEARRQRKLTQAVAEAVGKETQRRATWDEDAEVMRRAGVGRGEVLQ